MAAIELTHRKQIQGGREKSNPSRAADGIQKQIGGVRIWLQRCSQQLQDERYTEDEIGISMAGKFGDDSGVEHTVGQGGQRDQNPTSGPEAPTSNSARVERIGERMRRNAPNVPMRVGAGIKKG